MKIVNCELTDLDDVYKLYAAASAYQRTKNVVVWPDFDSSLMITEIQEKRMWKLVIDEQVACVWSITFSDKEIWEERDNDSSIYIHRIATNPNFRGQQFVKIIVDWSKQYAKENNKTFIRLDTLGNNTGLIKHYTEAGFTFLGMFRLTNTDSLPAHYQQTPDCCLFEIELGEK